MLQHRPTHTRSARHAAARPRTAVVLARLAIAALSTATFMSLAHAYFNH